MTPIEEVRRALRARFGARVELDRPLGPLTTYRVGGPAAAFVVVDSERDLLELRAVLAEHRVPVLVIGKGSNLLVSDRGFPGVAVQLGAGFADIELPPLEPGRGPFVVHAGAAVALPVLARRTVEAGLTGLEWAVGVPGSVGGALRMNAGGHGSDTAATLVTYRWMDLCREAGGEDGPDRLELGYRSSSLEPSQVVLRAGFALARGDPARGRATLAEIVRWRREHQPGGANAGSVFSNPEDAAAGALIEAAGLKGFRLGSAQVSPKHANFIQADDGGSADDVWRLIVHVASVVAERTGVRLRPEVHLVGFDEEGR